MITITQPTIIDGCKISKPAQKRIDFLCRLGFNMMIVPHKEYESYECAEESMNYIGEGLFTYDLDLPYIHIIPDNISQRGCEMMVESLVENLTINLKEDN
jgi:hypothetical protein